MKKDNPINLAQQALELRINKANAEIKPILDKHELAIGAIMQYTQQGTFAIPALIDNKNVPDSITK